MTLDLIGFISIKYSEKQQVLHGSIFYLLLVCKLSLIGGQ
jgi:hypothetical protein